jgi:hypothetical protein
VHPAVLVVEQIKNFVNSPVIPILETVIPGTLDDKIFAAIQAALPKVLTALQIADECAGPNTPADQVLQCVVKKLAALNPDARAAQYHSIASLLTVYLSDGKISWSEAIHLVEMVYQDRIK